jgi:hypothetical protein
MNDILNRLEAICDDDGGDPGEVLASYWPGPTTLDNLAGGEASHTE